MGADDEDLRASSYRGRIEDNPVYAGNSLSEPSLTA